jgi:hypothetical protein
MSDMLQTERMFSGLVVCSPACANGVCSGPNTCECDEGYTGAQCDEPGKSTQGTTSSANPRGMTADVGPFCS